MGACKRWAEKSEECAASWVPNSRLPNCLLRCSDLGVPQHCIGFCISNKDGMDVKDGICADFRDKTDKCKQSNEADLGACCKNQGVPYVCSGDCLVEGGVCEEWQQKVFECLKSDDGKECCERQGVPEGKAGEKEDRSA